MQVCIYVHHGRAYGNEVGMVNRNYMFLNFTEGEQQLGSLTLLTVFYSLS